MTDKKYILVISSSLHPASKSHVLSREAERVIESRGMKVRFLDLRDCPLPFCDGAASYSDESLPELKETVSGAAAILMGVPIYNFHIGAAGKNFIEMTGKVWMGKIVGFLCAAGGKASYMSIMALASSLMLDFRCLIIPRFVYAVGSDFEEDTILSDEIKNRIEELSDEAIRLATALGD